MSRIKLLVHYRWAMPVLAELLRSRGGKFVTLQHRLGVSRGALAPALRILVEQGWVRRNPGYGHPMRPEYLLTAEGARLAPTCDRLLRTLRRLGLERVALRKWSLPLTLALSGGGRFNELKELLPGITARALALALKALQEAGIVRRRVEEEYPPRPRYELTRRGRRLVPLLESI